MHKMNSPSPKKLGVTIYIAGIPECVRADAKLIEVGVDMSSGFVTANQYAAACRRSLRFLVDDVPQLECQLCVLPLASSALNELLAPVQVREGMRFNAEVIDGGEAVPLAAMLLKFDVGKMEIPAMARRIIMSQYFLLPIERQLTRPEEFDIEEAEKRGAVGELAAECKRLRRYAHG